MHDETTTLVADQLGAGLYHFFTDRAFLAQRTAWAENCPCPRDRACAFGQRHCAFEHSPRPDFSFNASAQSERHTQHWDALRALFKGGATTSSSASDEECDSAGVLDEVWSSISPCLAGPYAPYRRPALKEPEPQPQQLLLHNDLLFGLHFSDYAASHRLAYYSELCLHHARPVHPRKCRAPEQAHSLAELLGVFETPAAHLYYHYWMQYMAALGKAPQVALPLRVMRADDPALRCRVCKEGTRLRLRLSVCQPSACKMPACVVRCQLCRSKTVLSVYVRF